MATRARSARRSIPLSISVIDRYASQSSCCHLRIATYRRMAMSSTPPDDSAPTLAPGRLAGLLYALVFIAAVAQTELVPLLPQLAAADGLSTATTAALIAAPGAATFAVALPAGVFADRFGARRMTLAAGVLLAVGAFAQALPGVAPLLARRLGFGLAYGVVWATGGAWIAPTERDPDGAAPRPA